jgi:hypothetical protein
MPLSMLLSLSVLGLASMTFATDASAEVVCSGHKLLPIPRPQVELQQRQTADLPVA